MKSLTLASLLLIACICPLLAQTADSLKVDSAAADSSAVKSDSLMAQSSTDSITGHAGILYADGKPLYPLSPERQSLLHRYSQFVNTWRFAEFFIGLVLFGIILFTGLSSKLAEIARRAKRTYLVVWLYTALFLVVLYIIDFPFTFYREYYTEVKFGFMNQTFLAWFGESLLNLLIMAIIAPIVVYLFYWVIGRFRRWWLVFSLVTVPLLVLLIVISPVLISPLFNKFEPLQDKQLEHEILTLANRAGIEGSDVFEVNASKQSSKVNAYVTGLFGTKRIVLYDTLIKGFTYDEIKFVMGHEMGHYIMRHIWYGLLVAVVFLLVAFWLTDKTIHRTIHRFRHQFGFERLSDLASFPLVVAFLSIFSFFGQPLFNGMSRYMERQSDRYGLNITNVSADEAARAFEKLSAYNLSDPEPNALIEFWFYDHPALSKRIAFVREYRKVS